MAGAPAGEAGSGSGREAEACCFAGSDTALRSALEAALGGPVQSGLPTAATGLVVLQAWGPQSDVPGGNAFSACRALKDQPGMLVFVVLRAEDRYGAEIVRFCMADGVLTWDAAGNLDGVDALRDRQSGHRPRISVDALLQRLEQDMATDEVRRASAMERLLHHEREDTLVGLLTDPETGLYDGPYASHKLDEEFKRALRFHQPLSLILLDIGSGETGGLPGDEVERRALLAEVSSVFLNECRDIDILARFTETTFLFLLPGTGFDGARTLARRMLDALRERAFAGPWRVLPSAGLVTVPASGIANRRAFLAVAEACLEQALGGEGDDGLCTTWE